MIWVAVAFAAGTILGSSAALPTILLVAPTALLLLWALSLFYPSLRLRDIALVLSVFLAAGVVQGSLRARSVSLDPLAQHACQHLEARDHWLLEGIVRSANIYRPGQPLSFVVDVDTMVAGEQRLTIAGGVLVRWASPTGPRWPGERVQVGGRYDPTLSPVNFGLGSVEDYYRARGVHSALTLYTPGFKVLAPAPASLALGVAHLRQAQSELFLRYVPAESVPFILAVWMGESLLGDPSAYDAFVASGTAHVLSVSGVHVAIVYATVSALLSGMLRHRRLRAVLIIAAVIAFALLAGARVATLRAALMFAIYLAAELVDREPDAPTSLGLCTLLFLVWDPRLIHDIGFLLSFASVASILLLNDPIMHHLPKRLGGLRTGVATTISAQVLPFPIAAHTFHLLPAYGILANLVVVPLLTGVLWLCVLTVALGAVWDAPGHLFGQAAHVAVLAVRFLVRLVADLPGSTLSVASPTLFAVLFYWGMAWCGARLLITYDHARFWAWRTVLCGVGAMLLWSPWSLSAGVDVIDVGHGDAVLVRSPAGATMLIDGGDRSEFRDCGRRIVVPFLRARGISQLDYVVCSHPDRDHSGGLFHVLEQVRVGALVLAGQPTAHPLEAALIAVAKAHGVPVLRVVRGDTLPLRGAEVAVLHPTADFDSAARVNNLSVVLRVAWPGFSMLATGDIETPAEREVAANGGCTAVFLKVPHHGSHTSSTTELLRAVVPRVALCSTDAGSNRRPVAEAVAARYAALNVPLLRTDQLGGLRIRAADDGAYIVEGARAVRGYSLAASGDDTPAR